MAPLVELDKLSIALWFRARPTTFRQSLLDCDRYSWFQLFLNERGYLVWSTSPANGTQHDLRSNSKHDGNEWHLVVVTYETLGPHLFRKRLFNNDKQVAEVTTSATNPILKSDVLRFCLVGGTTDNVIKYGMPALFKHSLDGDISFMRMWTEALTKDNVEHMFSETCGLYGTC
jgi:hypothetical protein